MAEILASIRFRCSVKYFKEFAIPYLMDRSPNLELNYLFIDTNQQVFEHVIGAPKRIISLNLVKYTKVCIYGCTNKLIREVVDNLLRKGYRDYESLSDNQKLNLKFGNGCKTRSKALREEIILSIWHPNRFDSLLQAGIQIDDI